MKKIWILLLTGMLVLTVPLNTAAREAAGCTVSADTVAASVGETVTVPVRISGNPGFTNFAIGVKYDAAALRLERIDTAGDGEQAYLCPETASVNLAYVSEEGAVPCGYVSGAAAEAVTGDGVLFTVTFTVLRQISGAAPVDLELRYLRCVDALTSAFTALTTTVEDGKITVRGDVNGDGSVTGEDAAFVYRYVNEALTLTREQRSAADVNGDGTVDTTDAALIYRVAHNTLSGFLQSIPEEVKE